MDSVETRAVHGGAHRDPTHGSVATPVVLSSTFDYPELLGARASPYIYTRYANPTIEAAEARIAALHGTGRAVLFSSGMAAIAATLLTVLRSGDTVLASPALYGGTRELFDEELPRLGIAVHYLPMDADARAVTASVRDTDRLLYLESPTNPMLGVLDVPRLTTAAHDAGLPVALDNTFASPVLAQPARWGVDYVIESATKSLGGHSDLIAGVVAGSRERLETVALRRKRWGAPLDPAAAYRLLRGLPTLPLRVQRAGATALELAHRLADEPWVERVYHPGRADHPAHDIAAATLQGPLPLVTFVVRGGDGAAVHLRRRVGLIRPAASLGGVESLLSLPFETSQARMSPEERRAVGIPDGTVRLSVGLESVDDLVADLRQAATA